MALFTYTSKEPMLSSKRLNIIRGKALVGKASTSDVQTLLDYIDALESKLDEHDDVDFFGSEGWRHAFEHPDAD
jgi:hypothetical protein